MMHIKCSVWNKRKEARGILKINRRKYELARARACKGTRDLVADGIPRGTLSKIFHEEIRPETAGKIAKALGVDVTEIIETED